MNKERLNILAENAAKQMVDQTIPINERIQSIETDEIKALSAAEYAEFRSLMIIYMREIIKK